MKNKALKALLVGSMLASSAFADIYVGADFGQVGNTDKATFDTSTTEQTQTNKYSDIAAHIGFGTDGDWKMQLKLSKISYDLPIFDGINKELTEFGFDAIKEFEVSKSAYPFIKFGMGVGSMDVVGYTEPTIQEVSLNGGVGISYKAIDHLYLVAGVDYLYRKWQDVEDNSGFIPTTISVTGSGAKVYGGVNFGF